MRMWCCAAGRRGAAMRSATAGCRTVSRGGSGPSSPEEAAAIVKSGIGRFFVAEGAIPADIGGSCPLGGDCGFMPRNAVKFGHPIKEKPL